MFFPQKVKATLWSIIDSMALNLSSFVKKRDLSYVLSDSKIIQVHDQHLESFLQIKRNEI